MRWTLALVVLVAACDDGADLVTAECAPRVGLYRSEATRLMGACGRMEGSTFEPAAETTARHLDSCTTEYDNPLSWTDQDGNEQHGRVRAHVRWSRDGLSADGLLTLSEPGCESLWRLTYVKVDTAQAVQPPSYCGSPEWLPDHRDIASAASVNCVPRPSL